MKVGYNLLVISIVLLMTRSTFSQDSDEFQPSSTNFVVHKYYTLLYNEQHEQATWVSYMLCRDRLDGPWERTKDYRKDTTVSTGSATNEDYQGSGYERGHLAPAEDFSFDSVGMSESFYLSNMSPQVGACNHGIWIRLENEERRWAEKYDTLYITAGPILTDSLNTIGKDGVSVPDFYYKVILNKSGNHYKGIGFIIPNRKEGAKIKNFVVPIRFIESITTIDFFPELPDSTENEIEQNLNTDQWEFHAN